MLRTGRIAVKFFQVVGTKNDTAICLPTFELQFRHKSVPCRNVKILFILVLFPHLLVFVGEALTELDFLDTFLEKLFRRLKLHSHISVLVYLAVPVFTQVDDAFGFGVSIVPSKSHRTAGKLIVNEEFDNLSILRYKEYLTMHVGILQLVVAFLRNLVKDDAELELPVTNEVVKIQVLHRLEVHHVGIAEFLTVIVETRLCVLEVIGTTITITHIISLKIPRPSRRDDSQLCDERHNQYS